MAGSVPVRADGRKLLFVLKEAVDDFVRFPVKKLVRIGAKVLGQLVKSQAQSEPTGTGYFFVLKKRVIEWQA